METSAISRISGGAYDAAEAIVFHDEVIHEGPDWFLANRPDSGAESRK